MSLLKLFYDKYRNLRSKLVVFYLKNIYKNKFCVGKNFYVRKDFTVTIEENGFVKIGNNVFFNNFCSLNSLEGIDIEDDCIFGENVHIYDHNHIYEDLSIPINNQGFKKSKVFIGKNTWVGSNVVILKGVNIGEHCVIGAGCIIFQDIEPYSIVKNSQNLEIDHIIIQE